MSRSGDLPCLTGALPGTAQFQSKSKNHGRLTAAILAALVSFFSGTLAIEGPHFAHADDAWAVDRDAVWDDPANWLNGTVPDQPGDHAFFGPVITAPRTVTVQDVTNGHGNDDGVITVGEITFDSAHTYTIGRQSGALTLDNGDQPVVVRALSDAGYFPQTIFPQQVRLEGDLILDSDIAGGVSIFNVVASDRTVTKIGRGRASLHPSDLYPFEGMSYNIFDGRLQSEYFGFPIQNVRVNGGTLAYELQNATRVFYSPLEIGDDGGVLDLFSGRELGAGGVNVSAEDRLRGNGRLLKTGDAALWIERRQPNFRGPMEIARGALRLAGSLSHPLPNVPSIAVGRDADEYRAVLTLGNHDYRATSISIGPGSELVGSHGPGLGLASLVRGQNLTLAEDAVIAQLTDGGNQSIGNLGAAADLYFGLAARELGVLNLTVGAGTPWKGISGSSLESSRINGGTIVANSDLTIKHRGRALTLGSADGTTGLNIVSSGPRRNLTIAVDPLYADGQPIEVTLSGENVDLSGIGKLVVAPQARVQMLGRDMLGRGAAQVPIVDLLHGASIKATGFGVGDQAASINVLGSATVELVHSGSGDIDFGGDFVISHPAGVTFRTNGNSVPAEYRLGSLRLTSDGDVNFSALFASAKQMVITGPVDIGGFDVLLSASAGIQNSNMPTVVGPLVGNGTLRVRGPVGGGITLDNELTEFRGAESRVMVESGLLRLGDASMFDLGPSGPRIELQETQSTGTLSFAADVDLGAKLTPSSTGVLALRGTHSALSGVNGSYAFLGADGMASLAGRTLQPGAEQTYRLGGGAAGSVLTIGSATTPSVLSGNNGVIVGPRSGPSDMVVEFAGPINYTGATSVQSGTLALIAPRAIAGGVAAGPIDISASVLAIRDQGTLGATGPITVRQGGRLSIVSDGAAALDRIPDQTPIVLRESTFWFQGTSDMAKSSEVVGSQSLTIAEGHNTVAIRGAGAGARLEIGRLVRDGGATVAFEGLARDSTPAEPQQILVGNGNALLASGIIPWAITRDPSFAWDNFAGYSESGIVSYNGPLVTQLDGAGPADIVSLQASRPTLSRNTTIGALAISDTETDLAGHTLNVGAVPIDGVAIGALIGRGEIGTIANPGFLTAGQAAFAPGSAFPGELIVHKGADVNSTIIRAAIVDNAGPDGIFGNADDLPVALTVAGVVTLNGSGNRYSGGTTVQGYLLANRPLGPGPVHLESGVLHLVSETPDVPMAAGPIVMSGGTLRGQVPGATTANPGTVRVRSLKVSPDPVDTNVVTNIVVEDSLDVRGARVLLNSGNLVFEGDLLADSQTLFTDTFTLAPALIARTGKLTRISATINGPALRAHGSGTDVRFDGTGFSRRLLASERGRLVVEPAATLTSSSARGAITIGGDGTGVVEFADGFKLVRRFGQPREPNIGIAILSISDGVTWVTNGTDNLPNIDPGQMRNEDDYYGQIDLAWPNSAWRVASHAQSYNQRLGVLTSTRLVTDADLTFEPESLAAFDSSTAPQGSQSVSLTGAVLAKSGAADLRLLGRLCTIHTNAIDVREGRLVMKNRTVEGTGSLDIRIHTDATLTGGNATGTLGRIPGMIHAVAGGRVDPGDGDATGVLSVVGDAAALVLETDSIFQPTLQGAVAGTLHDQLRVAGDVELGDADASGQAILAPTLRYSPILGDLLFLIDNDDADPIAGLFKAVGGGALSQGSSFDLVSATDGQAYRFEIGYTGDAPSASFSAAGGAVGNDVVLRNAPIGPGWARDASGNWSDAANWSPRVPNAAGEEAYFGPVITAPRTLNVDVPVTVGRMSINSAHSYTLAGPGPITFDVITGDARLQVVGGNHFIQSPIVLADDLVIAIPPAASALSIASPLNADGRSITKTGAGTLRLSKVRPDAFVVEGGTVQLTPGSGTSVFRALSIAGGAAPSARLDLTNNAAIVDYTGPSLTTDIRQQILAGRGGPGFGAHWNGMGITSSAAAAFNATEPEARSIGYAENSALPLGPYTTFRGETVDNTSVLLAYTRTGDANLDGVVNDEDVTILGATYAPGVAQPHWALGDFDYNGFVDDDDVTLLGAFYDPTAAPLNEAINPSSSSSVTAVPEPGTFLLAAAAIVLAIIWRRATASATVSRVAVPTATSRPHGENLL